MLRKTIISVSGGKTSSYCAAHYHSDFLVSSIVRTTKKECKFKDEPIRNLISDRLGVEFWGTLEDDNLIYTLLDLEQYLGQKINIITGDTFDDVIKTRGGVLPSMLRRYCTTWLKVIPIAEWIYSLNLSAVPYLVLGYRANEVSRAKKYISNCNSEGVKLIDKIRIGKNKNGTNKWLKNFEYCIPVFPLIEDGILRYDILKYWEGKKIRFQRENNCIGCFHKKPHNLKKQSIIYPEKYQWFCDAEKMQKGTWKENITYENIKELPIINNLFEDSEGCDSGFCGM